MGEAHSHKIAALFPGQGAFYGGALREAIREYPQLAKTLKAVDEVAEPSTGRPISLVLLGASPPEIAALSEDPLTLNLAIYAVSVAAYTLLEEQGLAPEVLAGHSFGEIAALVCAKSFTVREGAEIVRDRCAALEKLGRDAGYMAALGTGAARAAHLVAALGREDVALAVDNGPSQVVLAGSHEGMDQALAVASALQVTGTRLHSPYPFHVPSLMEPVARDFAARLRHLRPAPPRRRVFSPIEGREYTAGDDLIALLAGHLARPVRFREALEHLGREGVTTFIECGALGTLGNLVRQTLKPGSVRVVSCLPSPGEEVAALQRAMRLARGEPELSETAQSALAELFMPGASVETFRAFWQARGEELREHARKLAQGWRTEAPLAASVSPAAPPAPAPSRAAVPELKAAAAPQGAGAPAAMNRSQLLSELARMFAEALEYPEEVLTENVDLEAELGIDSVKQVELLAKIEQRYRLPPRPPSFRLGDYRTLGSVADFVLDMREQPAHG
ncbi:MAG TPA: acyltransferase domain-containing protein [Hyalangium sp.]|nr:acyltransferase domain-containing protein [Hyalangium sp.]